MTYLLAVLLNIQIQTIKLETKEEYGIQLITDFLHNNSVDNRVNFVGGESVFQREERERISRELASKASYQRGTSYTSGKAEIIGKSYEQCVVYAKRRSGITRSIGYAGNAQIQSTTPQVGSIGIEKSKVGHAVYIEAVEGNKITITEANFLRGYITKRVLDISQFKGFIMS